MNKTNTAYLIVPADKARRCEYGGTLYRTERAMVLAALYDLPDTLAECLAHGLLDTTPTPSRARLDDLGCRYYVAYAITQADLDEALVVPAEVLP